jgi:DNA-binding FadR family transcriptional regulator
MVEKVSEQLATMLRVASGQDLKLHAERELAVKLGVSRNGLLREATKCLELRGCWRTNKARAHGSWTV